MGDNRQQAKYAAARAALIEEVEHLVAVREGGDLIAVRLGVKAASLARRLERAGRGDLAGYVRRGSR